LSDYFARNLSHHYPDYKALAEETPKQGSSDLKGHFGIHLVKI
jgi:hypothetical protein